MIAHTRRRHTRLAALLPLLIALVLTLAACGPEDDRERGDGRGSGADPDNRDASVELQGDDPRDDRIFVDTPEKLPAVAAPESEDDG